MMTIRTQSDVIKGEEYCVVCGEEICLRDYNEFWLVEPLNKRFWTFRICNQCQDSGRFAKWLQTRFGLEEGES